MFVWNNRLNLNMINNLSNCQDMVEGSIISMKIMEETEVEVMVDKEGIIEVDAVNNNITTKIMIIMTHQPVVEAVAVAEEAVQIMIIAENQKLKVVAQFRVEPIMTIVLQHLNRIILRTGVTLGQRKMDQIMINIREIQEDKVGTKRHDTKIRE